MTYHNPEKRDTFGPQAATISSITVHKNYGTTLRVDGSVIAGGIAEDIRSGNVKKLEIELA
ncbi:hypothetical protein D3C76_1552060 [compost metagenome]